MREVTGTPPGATGLADPRLLGRRPGLPRHRRPPLSAPRCGAEVEAYAELVAGGRTPGDLLLQRAEATDPLTVLTEEAHA